MASKRRKKSNPVEPKFEITASGQALQNAARLLGITDIEAELDKDPVSLDIDKPRPREQGLGAKYLPHSKAVLLTAGVEHRLKNKVLKSAADSKRYKDGDDDSNFQLHKKQKYKGGLGQHPKHTKTAANDSDSDDEGRGKAFTTDTQRPKHISRDILLQSSGKKKNKKNKDK